MTDATLRSDNRPTVAIIQPFVPNYRVGLFDAIADGLAAHGYRLEVWHAQPKGRVAARGNATSGRWSVPIRQHRVSIGRRNITFRPVHRRSRRVQAVIAGLASTNVETYGLALDPGVNLMLWGHGRNFTAANNALDGRVEHWLAKRATHVFSYTDEGKDVISSRGIPPESITVVQNTTDADLLREIRATTTPERLAKIRAEHGFGDRPVVLFVGAFDEPKKLPFLIRSFDLVHQSNPDALLVLAGAGPDEPIIRELAATRDYVKLIGRLDTRALAEFAGVVSMVAMPGRVGLVAVDALALGLPVVTTTYPFHAPEAAYLTDGISSVWTDFDETTYALEIASLLGDRGRLSDLAAGAHSEGLNFSVKQSADRFVRGVLQGLGAQ